MGNADGGYVTDVTSWEMSADPLIPDTTILKFHVRLSRLRFVLLQQKITTAIVEQKGKCD